MLFRVYLNNTLSTVFHSEQKKLIFFVFVFVCCSVVPPYSPFFSEIMKFLIFAAILAVALAAELPKCHPRCRYSTWLLAFCVVALFISFSFFVCCLLFSLFVDGNVMTQSAQQFAIQSVSAHAATYSVKKYVVLLRLVVAVSLASKLCCNCLFVLPVFICTDSLR